MKLKNGSDDVVFRLGAGSSKIADSFFVPEVVESFSSLQSKIDAESGDRTIDLEGKHYAPASVQELEGLVGGSYFAVDGIFYASGSSITFENGKISGTVPLTWSDEGSGVYSADLPSSNNAKLTYSDYSSNIFAYLVDEDQPSHPIIQARKRHTNSTARAWHAMARNQEWYTSRASEGRSDFSYTASGSGGTSAVVVSESLAAEWDQIFGATSGVDENIDVSGTTTCYWYSANRVDTIRNSTYNSFSRTLTFANETPEDVSQFMAVVFTGVNPVGDLDLGEYCMRLGEGANGKIYYRPRSGNPNNARISFLSTFMRPNGGSSQTVTFSNVTLQGFYAGTIAASGIFVPSGTGDNAETIAIENGSTIRYANVGVRQARVNISDSRIYEFSDHFGTTLSAGSVVRSYIGNTANSSQFYFAFSSVSKPIVFEDNFFTLPASTHGSCVAAYFNSWQNASFRHNIFYNIGQRSVGLAPSAGGDVSNIGTFEFSNNLIYTDELLDLPIISGQAGVAMLSDGNNLNLPSGTPQKIIVQNNSFVLSEDIWNNRSSQNTDQPMEADLSKAYYCETLVSNNIMMNTWLGTSSDYSGSTLQSGLGSVSNGYVNDSVTMLFEGFGKDDILETTYSNVFSSNSVEPTGSFATAATDGGNLGIRWAIVPSPSDVQSINETKNYSWSFSFPEETLPSVSFPASSDFIIVRGDDKRP